ncbi:hypothetical protein [Streptomyces sp. UG1]|uniref:hypothetical protein n=1 Tax=Streptomyces sp. UG1 TaxID=3417652 RepID=UPI003CFA346D
MPAERCLAAVPRCGGMPVEPRWDGVPAGPWPGAVPGPGAVPVEPCAVGGRLPVSGDGFAGIGRRWNVDSAAVSAGALVRRGAEGRPAGRGGVPEPSERVGPPTSRDPPPTSVRPAMGGASGKRAEARGGGGASAVPEVPTAGDGMRALGWGWVPPGAVARPPGAVVRPSSAVVRPSSAVVRPSDEPSV